ncbi:MAG: metallophosphoesterase [Candidatus Bipolaricaulota bacterium]|nr:metallophosphoesterase [Candidatus Bipolaricaulota bacterium]
MVRALLLALLVSVSGSAWEFTIAFTNDLHAYSERLLGWAPVLAQADLVLDAGDTWEDTHRLTGAREAWATLRAMAELGYDAMVLGNHETYLGPQLLGELLAAAPFPVLATNLRSPLPTREWALLEANGVRVLVLGVLWDLALVWPGWELREPLAAIREALARAPARDLFVLLAHLDWGKLEALARALPECDLVVSGHNHRYLEEPAWVGRVPIVQAGGRGQAVGLVSLGPDGLVRYRLLRPAGARLEAAPPL